MEKKKILVFNAQSGVPDIIKCHSYQSYQDRVYLAKMIETVPCVISYKRFLYGGLSIGIEDYLRTHPEILIKTLPGRYYGWDSNKGKIIIMYITKCTEAEFQERNTFTNLEEKQNEVEHAE